MRNADISATISPVRLQRFVTAAGNTTDALRLYRWNAQLAAAYWTPLHFMEVAVRNAVHDSLAATMANPRWFKDPAVPGRGAAWLYPFEAEAVEKAIDKIFDPVTPDKVVAELHFGFWVGLLSGRYVPAQGGTDYHSMVWVKGGVSKKFGVAKRRDVHKRLDRLRRFRNRVAHHEHLMGENLDVVSADIDTILRILCPATATWVRAMSDVTRVRRKRPC